MHTKGPWTLEKTSAGYTIRNSKDIWIADLGNEWYPSSSEIEQFEANARLIAAAPELLEALDGLVLVIGLTAIKHEGQLEVLQEAVELANEAISKAKSHADTLKGE